MLSDKQKRVLELIKSGSTHAAAAAEVGCSPQLISEWKKRVPEFRAHFYQAPSDVINVIVEQINPLLPGAAKALKECLASPSGQVKIKAAGMVLEYALRGLEMGEMAQQIAEMEAQLAIYRNTTPETQSTVPLDTQTTAHTDSSPADAECGHAARPMAG